MRIKIIKNAALAHEAQTVAGAAAANTQLEYREHTAAADAAVLAFARSKLRLFAGLRAAVVNLGDALDISRAIMTSCDAAIEHYKAALVLLPNSAGTMRAYGNFLNSVNDRTAGAAMVAAADSLEEARHKQSARMYRRVTWKMPTSFDVALETNGVIQVRAHRLLLTCEIVGKYCFDQTGSNQSDLC